MSLNGHKALYQPWNEDEFVSGSGVQYMTSLEAWMYRTLLQKAFFCPTRPYLPDDDNVLWRMAGCENKEQWKENKRAVLKNFQKFSENGQKLLKQARLEIDWNREQKRRQVLANNGRKGGLTTQAKAQAPLDQGSSTELNRTNRTEPNETNEADMSAFKDRICRLARKHLRVTIQTNDKDFSELLARARTFEGDGQMAVGDAFETFCIEREGTTVDYPLRVFLNRFDGYVEQSASVHEAPEAKNLVNELAFIAEGSGIGFDKKQQTAIGRLLETYRPEEVRSAFQEFYQSVNDDFDKKHAARKFVETAEQILYTQRKRKEAARKTEELIRQATIQERKKAEDELLERLRADEAENALVEDTLPAE
jgi:Protein of unknown function (DUF1376)